jgi:serine/threonine-protein phosphatase 2A activator
MRYGNRAFKDWYVKASEETSRFLDQILPEKIKGAKDELYRYIMESWGSNVRIDYGSGHEMSFMYFCWALYRIGFCGAD